MNSDDLENIFINKLDEFAPYLALVYVSDKSKTGVPHVML